MTGLCLIVYHKHDLPPKWDGEPVTWEPWETEPLSTFRFHATDSDRACNECGLIDAHRQRTVGRFSDSNHPHVWRLTASRCKCGHDTVTDPRTGEVWDLEPHDYDDEGSTPDGQLW